MQKPAANYLVIIFAGASFMEMFDGTVILTALPAMAASFGVSPLVMGVGITSYLLALAAVLPASGWIADRFGTRRVFMLAVALFGVASVACGLSHSFGAFMLSRVVQGLAGALMSPVARITLLKLLDRHTMLRAMNIGIMAALMGPTIGPAVGGAIATWWNWRWIFFINVPIAILALLATWWRYPDVRDEQLPTFDWRGALLNAAAMIGVIYGLQLLAEGRADWRLCLAVAAGGLVIGGFALRHAQRFAAPILSLRALQVPTFRTAALTGFVARLAVFAPMFVLPLLLQLGLGMSAFLAGIYMLLTMGADLLAKIGLVGGLRIFGHRRVLIWSAALYPLFVLGLMALTVGTPAWAIALLAIFGGVVRSYQMSAINTLGYSDLPIELSSGASTLQSAVQQVSQAVGVALSSVLIHLGQVWRDTVGQPLQRADFAVPLLFAACCAWLTVLSYRSLPDDAGARASGYVPRRPGTESG
jgi:EmrB/QacA subfamily drug resistance transporter